MGKYGCGSPIKPRPASGAVYAPFVEVTLGGMITVGNKSYPSEPHSAVIKSMDYGSSTGSGITIEIIDEAGTSFTKYFESVNKDMCSATEEYDMQVDFGWLARGCDGSMTRSGIPDGKITFLPKEIESSYEGGVIKYTIKGEDLLSHMGENRVATPIGTEANRVNLNQAIRKVFARNCPAVNRVLNMRRRGESMMEWKYKNSDGGPKGPSSVWPPDQQNAMSAVRSWSNSVTTDRRRGFYPVWNPGSQTPELWLLEDTRSYCDETASDTCIGTYIVNGGDCSPVISFSPQAKWVFSANMGSGGGSGGPTGGRQMNNRPMKGRLCIQSEKRSKSANRDPGGTTTQFSPPQHNVNWRPPDEITTRQQEAMAAHELATQYPELSAPMEGELKVHGDPRFVHPVQWTGKMISIIVINPFNIFSTSTYCEWLAGPMCNPIYSDKNWAIEGVSHQISEGTYTTTFKVKCHNVAKLDNFVGA